MPGEEQVDRDLIERVRAGDSAAFDSLVERHQHAVRRVARQICGDAELGDDAAQEAFVTAWQHLDSWRGDGSFLAWLLTVTRHAALRMVRRRAGEPTRFEPVDTAADDLPSLGAAAGWGAPSPERHADAAEQLRAVSRALASLTPADREVIVLRDIEGLSGDEAAEVLELPLRTMKTRLHRARLRLMAALAEGGSDE